MGKMDGSKYYTETKEGKGTKPEQERKKISK